MTALCLRILQAALVYVNTLMLQDVLAQEAWAAMLGPADRRGLTPLFWQHVRPTARSALTWEHASGSAARAKLRAAPTVRSGGARRCRLPGSRRTHCGGDQDAGERVHHGCVPAGSGLLLTMGHPNRPLNCTVAEERA